MIPRLLHRIWLGDHPRPAVYDDYWRQWAALHPGWDLHIWTERNMPPLRNQAEYDYCEYTASAGILIDHQRAVAVQRADIAAYELVWRFGGVYVNCDMQPLRPLNDLLGHLAFAGMEDDRYLGNAVLGGEPRSPFFDAVISELPFRVVAYPHAGMRVQTGPHLLTAVWWTSPDLITVLPRKAFYSTHHGQIHGGGYAAAHVEAAHRAGAYATPHLGHRACMGDLGVSSSSHAITHNEATREAEGQRPYQHSNEESAPLPPAGDGALDTATGITPGMRHIRPDRR